MTLLLLLAAAFFALQEGEDRDGLSFRVGGEVLLPWVEDGYGYVFLPSYVNLEGLTVQTEQPLVLEELVLKNGMDCGGVELGRYYRLENGEKLTFLKSENVPALFLDTASGSMDYIHREKGNEESGRLRLYDAQGTLNAAGDIQAVKARGNSTFDPEKKPYSLTLSRKGDLLGMGAAKNWVLLANALDSSHLKNKFAYDFAGAAGLPYSPESRFVDLYLNGEYRGLYLLCERNELGENRIEVEDGFLVSKEQIYNLGDALSFQTDAGAWLRVRGNTLGQSRMEEIFQQAEDAILDPAGDWQRRIDLDSWAGKYLIEEIFGGIDAGIGSQYFFYDRAADKIFAGPVWDYDDTMGVDIWLGGELFLENTPEIFYAHRSKETPWFHSLYDQPEFYERMTQLYRETYAPLLAEFLQERLPDYRAQIEQAALLNQTRWDTRDLGEQVAYLSWFLRERMEFLNAAWTENRPFIPVHVDYSYEEFLCTYAIFDYAVTPGGFLPRLPAPEGYSWYLTGTDKPFDQGRPILEETAVELRRN
ncbi:MAG: CotH kinase family protein [Eubacteriales bacterium]|nr:CotH kinase family protein [Eubacteriales bacterium]